MKKSFLIMVCTVLIGILSCCGTSNKESEEKLEIDINDDTIQLSIDDYVEVDAKIFIPESLEDMEMNIVKAKRPFINEKKIRNIFMPDNQIISRDLDRDYICREFGKYDIIYYSGEQNDFMSIEPSDIYYTKNEMEYIRNCVFTDPKFSNYNLDKYSLEEDLSFASRETVFNKIKDVYANLGINISEDYYAYALNHKILRQEENPIDSNGKVVDNLKKNKWTSNDDAYYFVLHQEINGVPIEQIQYGDGYTGTGIEETELTATYGAKGWMEFTEEWGYVIEPTNQRQQIISVEEAINSLKLKCDMLLSKNQWKINSISLKLIPIFIKDNDYEIRPVWVFEGEINNSDNYKSPLMILFDGITGKEITS